MYWGLHNPKNIFNNLLYIDSGKIFAKKKNKKEMGTFTETIILCRQDMGLKFGIGKCAILIKNSRKRETTERIELPNLERITTLNQLENYNYMEELEV